MKREEILSRLGFVVPEAKKKRVIVHSDVACEADDHYAIVHHLLTPSENVVGIIAAHFEYYNRIVPQLAEQRYKSMGKSYAEGQKILDLMGIDDVPLMKGSDRELTDREHLPDSPGADFIIAEAMKEDNSKLFIALQGSLTDLAIAWLKEPKIAERLTAVWIGGGRYPDGKGEFNMQQDVLAAQIVFESDIPLWQIPSNVYGSIHLTFSELISKVKPCGEIGRYLTEEMFALNDFYGKVSPGQDFPHGETWCLGDQPTVGVLLQNPVLDCWHLENRTINDDMTYGEPTLKRSVKVYDNLDCRMTMDDFYTKLKLCYGD